MKIIKKTIQNTLSVNFLVRQGIITLVLIGLMVGSSAHPEFNIQCVTTNKRLNLVLTFETVLIV